MPLPREWSFGTHRAWFEAPDVLWMKIRGETSLEDAVAILEASTARWAASGASSW
ncbi:hypothetical protein ACN28I_35120 [Archangium gephyra]|uniref:hypothetical protein n=1 Tax=Archangium gephyra TaxID=48 RepID=UPI003B8292EF